MTSRTEASRRSFLQRTVGTVGFLAAAPMFVPSRAFGANERIATGHIGLGGQGRGNLRAFSDEAVALCDREIGDRTATACHLGNIAIRLGRPIRWNAATESIEGDEEAAAMTSRPGRAPWLIDG